MAIRDWEVSVTTCFQDCVRGPNAPTSQGWRACVVCDGRQIIMIFRSAAYLQNENVQCELCPSKIKRRYCPVTLSHVAGSKSFWSHAKPNSWSVQPFGEMDMLSINISIIQNKLIQISDKPSITRVVVTPLWIPTYTWNITGRTDPSAQMHSMTVLWYR